jgi:hypothetical protein
MAGGRLVLCATVGPLAGEAQAGGELFLPTTGVGLHAGRGARGGSRSTTDDSWLAAYSKC